MPIIDNNDSRKAFEEWCKQVLQEGHDILSLETWLAFKAAWGKAEEAAQQHFLKMLESEEVAAAVTDGLAAEALAAAKGEQRYTEAGAFTERLSKASLSAIKAKLGAA